MTKNSPAPKKPLKNGQEIFPRNKSVFNDEILPRFVESKEKICFF
jgi:hypothetical protein